MAENENPHDGLTSPAEWNKQYEEGVKFHFPSGLEAMVRPVNVATFVRLAKIPDTLSPIVSKAISGQIDTSNISLEEWAQLYEVYDIFCETCFVWPCAVREIKDPANELLLDNIPDFDKVTLFQFMGYPARTLESFRPFEEKPVDSVVSKSRNKTVPKRTA